MSENGFFPILLVAMCLSILSPSAFSDAELKLRTDGKWRIMGHSHETIIDGELYRFTGYSEGELTFEENADPEEVGESGFIIGIDSEGLLKPDEIYLRQAEKIVNKIPVEVYSIDENLGLPPMQIWQFALPEEYYVRMWGSNGEDLEVLADQLTMRELITQKISNQGGTVRLNN